MEILIVLSVAGAIFSGALLLVHLLKLKAARDLANSTPPAAFLELAKRAFQMVWVEQYSMDPTKAPRIVWVMGDRLNCANGRGWVDGFGRCVAGLSWESTRTCSVAYYPGRSISEMALAHELWHAVGWLSGVDDPDHKGPGFAPDGDVARANKVLKDAGL